MSRRLYLCAAALSCTLAALVGVGCGGTTHAGVSGEPGAGLIHSGALAYVAIDSDLDSAQWDQVDELLRKFPAREKLIREVKKALAEEDVDYDRDVKPALGPEVDIAVDADRGEDPAFALLTKPDSFDKARALVRRFDRSSGDRWVTREVDGWLAVSHSDAMLDRVLKGAASDSLADDATFKAAFGELPGDALAKAYVNGRQLGEFADTLFGSGAQTTAFGGGAAPFGFDKLDWVAAAATAKADGVRFEAGVKGESGSRLTGAGKPYESKLISGIPADALAFLSFRGSSLGRQLRDLRANPVFGQGLDEIEKQLGMRLDEVLELFAHEVAFYVRRGAGLPEFSLVLETPDTEAALTTLDRLANRVARLVGARVGEDREAGVAVKTLTIRPVTIRWAGFDGRVLLTTGPTAISDYRDSGAKLADDSEYKHALDAAGAPDETAGLLYVNLHDGVRLIENYLGLAGEKMPPEVAANLKPLQSLVVYNSTSGDLSKVVAFLEIK